MNDAGLSLNDRRNVAVSVRAETFRELAKLQLPAAAEHDAATALRQVRLEGQYALFAAAQDAELPPAQAIPRLAGLWSLTASINVMDDIADGDCNYLEPRAAPGTVVLLQNLGILLTVAGGAVDSIALRNQALGLLRMAAGQNVEVRTDTWSIDAYLRTATDLGGAQYAAHLACLWSNTALTHRAVEIGNEIGALAMVAKDILSFDRRLTALPRAQLVEIARAATTKLDALRSCKLRCVEVLAEYAEPALRALAV